MLAFSRLASFLLFVLSLSLLTCAAPTVKSESLAVRGVDADGLVKLMAEVHAKLDVHAATCGSVTDISAAALIIADVCADLKVVVDTCAELGSNVLVSADVKAKVAAELAAYIQIIIKICASLVAKFGLNVAISLCVQLDAMLKICLLAVEACVSGVISLCVKLLIDIDVNVLLHFNLELIARVLGLVKLDVVAKVGAAITL